MTFNLPKITIDEEEVSLDKLKEEEGRMLAQEEIHNQRYTSGGLVQDKRYTIERADGKFATLMGDRISNENGDLCVYTNNELVSSISRGNWISVIKIC